jgi:hypothetical protein
MFSVFSAEKKQEQSTQHSSRIIIKQIEYYNIYISATRALDFTTMSVPAWKLRMQMQQKEAGDTAEGTTNQSAQAAELPKELQVKIRSEEAKQATEAPALATTRTAAAATAATTATTVTAAATSCVHTEPIGTEQKNENGEEAYSGPKEQEKSEFAYRAPEDNIKVSFVPKKWEKTAFQGNSPMDFFVRQNNEKKKVKEQERQAAARVYKHNTYDKSMFE